MALTGADLQRVMDLVPDYSRTSSPRMRAREEACRHLQNQLRGMLATMLALSGGSPLDVAVGGHQGSYSPLAWVRIYSRKHAPNATAGIYLAYLFAADGSQVYLSLQQGSSEVRSGRMRPVNDPAELLARGAAARSTIHDLVDSPLGAGMTIEIDLRWRELISVGAYSKQRIRNYEYANILAIRYESGAVLAADTLLADLRRGVVLLDALYGGAPLWETAVPAPGSRVDMNVGAAQVQGLLKDAAIRRAVEVYAEDCAEAYLLRYGWRVVERVGPKKLGYDLDCVNDVGARLHVEVKGTQGTGEEVFLTRNEASHCGPLSECSAEHALFVLSGIDVSGTGDIKCTGGIPNYRHPWTRTPDIEASAWVRLPG